MIAGPSSAMRKLSWAEHQRDDVLQMTGWSGPSNQLVLENGEGGRARVQLFHRCPVGTCGRGVSTGSSRPCDVALSPVANSTEDSGGIVNVLFMKGFEKWWCRGARRQRGSE